jgi:hypothetical protein
MKIVTVLNNAECRDCIFEYVESGASSGCLTIAIVLESE